MAIDYGADIGSVSPQITIFQSCELEVNLLDTHYHI